MKAINYFGNILVKCNHDLWSAEHELYDIVICEELITGTAGVFQFDQRIKIRMSSACFHDAALPRKIHIAAQKTTSMHFVM